MWLVQIRTARGISQQQVADAAGISRAGYTNIENEKRRPSPEVAQKIGAMILRRNTTAGAERAK